MSKLWQELDIKGKVFPNRLVFPPIATEIFKHTSASSIELENHYRLMASSGVGTVMVEHSYIMPQGKFSPAQLSIDEDEDIYIHQKLAETIRKQSIISGIQLNHAGAHCLPSVQQEICYSPSSIRLTPGEVSLKTMDRDDIDHVITAFSKAAKRAVQAGYDIVELHSAHGFLLSQFLSPVTNHRQDAYGGSLNGRMRLLMEIVDAVQAILSENILLAVRLGISDNPPGYSLHEKALSLEEGLKIATALQEKGLDLLDISGGLCGSRPANCENEAYFIPFAQAVKDAGIRVPIIITGGIQQLSSALNIIDQGISDFVGIGRALYQDKAWLTKEKNK